MEWKLPHVYVSKYGSQPKKFRVEMTRDSLWIKLIQWDSAVCEARALLLMPLVIS